MYPRNSLNEHCLKGFFSSVYVMFCYEKMSIASETSALIKKHEAHIGKIIESIYT